MYKRAQSTHKLPVHSAKGFVNFSASLAILPPTCLSVFRASFVDKGSKDTAIQARTEKSKFIRGPPGGTWFYLDSEFVQ
jgi:uncharacterized protein YchJ